MEKEIFKNKIASASEADCKEASEYPEDFDYAIFKKMVATILRQPEKWWQSKEAEIDLEDLVMSAEDWEEEDWKDFLSAYRIND